MTAYLRLVRNNPDFARLWFAQVISLTGDWFNTIVLATLVVAYAPEEAKGLAVSGFVLARFIPPMLISPVAGVLVDRFDRKLLLVMSNLLRAGVVLLFIPATYNPDLLWTIYVLSIMQFILSAVFEPGQSAITPSLIPHSDLVLANTLYSVTWSVMLAAGAVVGGIVSTLFGAQTALIIDALTFVVAAWLIWRIRGYSHTPRARTTDTHDDTTFAEGLRYLRRTPEVSTTLMVKFGGGLGNVDTLLPIYATHLFVLGNSGELSLGIMHSAFGVGAILGPLVLNRFNNGSLRSMRRLIAIGFVWIVLGWLFMAEASSLWIVCLALVARAMGGSVNWTYSSVMLQKAVPDHFLGRVFAMDMAGFYLATVLSALVHGTVIDLIGPQNAPLVALGTMFVSLVPLAVWLLVVRWLERRGYTAKELAAASVGD